MPRPKLHDFWVVGGARATFPLDMLRYDGCWPADGRAVSMMDHMLTDLAARDPLPTERLVSIQLRGIDPPTVARWQSFGWTVNGQT